MVNGKKLNQIIIKILKKKGLSSKHSKICSKAIINAELVGAHSHGLSRLKMYCDRINKKVINPKPKIKIKKISQSISQIDANNSIGFVAADIGIKQAIKNAKKTGIGLVGIKNSGHYGLSGYYAEQAVKKNLIAFCFTNAPPAIAPHGARKSLFGTNPICFGTPTSSKIPFIKVSSTLFEKLARSSPSSFSKVNPFVILKFSKTFEETQIQGGTGSSSWVIR